MPRSSVALALALCCLAPRAALADDRGPPGPPPPPPYQGQPPPAQQQQPYPPAAQPSQAPPASPPGTYAPPGNYPPPGYPPGSYPPPASYPPGTYAPPPGYPPPGYPPPAYGAQYNPSGYAPSSFGPEEISDFDDGQPVPYGYTRVNRTRKGLIIGGAVTLGSTYLVSAFAGAVADDVNRADGSSNSSSSLWVPIAGPFLEISQTDSAVARFYLVGLGLGQTAGAIMLIYGLTSPRALLVRNDQLGQLRVVPLAGGGASGLALSGRF